jgi:hypothetical protein
MTDDALKNAMARHNALSLEIAGLGKRVAELKAEQGRINRFIEDWHEFAGGGDTGLRKGPEIAPAGSLAEAGRAVDLAVASVQDERKKRATGNPRKEDVVETAMVILALEGAPMSRTALFNALKHHGVILQGADPEMVLSTMLWRMRDKIVRLKGGGYWLAECPWEPAGYLPHQNTDGTTVAELPPHELEHAIGGALDDEQ